MDNAKSNESIFSELDDIIDFDDVGDVESPNINEVDTDEDLTPSTVTVKVRFKSGYEKDIEVNLPVDSDIFDGTLTRSNILDYIGTAYAFTESTFLALPIDANGSHVFIEVDATDFIEVIR